MVMSRWAKLLSHAEAETSGRECVSAAAIIVCVGLFALCDAGKSFADGPEASGQAEAPATKTVRVHASDWATVIKRDGKPVNVWPEGNRLAGGMWARHFWKEECDAYTYLKFRVPSSLKGHTIRRVTLNGYVLSQYGAPWLATVWAAHLPADDWSRTDSPFPFYAQDCDTDPRASDPVNGGAVVGNWVRANVTPCLLEKGEGPGELLTLQLRRGLPGRRGWSMVGPAAKKDNAPDPRRPFLEIEYVTDHDGRAAPRLALSRGEKWHRKNGLFFSGWMSESFTEEMLAAYRDLYPYAFGVHWSRENMQKLVKTGMPFVVLGSPKADRLLPASASIQVGCCLDEDVLFRRDRGHLGRIETGSAAVAALRKARPGLLSIVGLHAWNRSRGAIDVTTAIDMDVPAGEVYPFLNSVPNYGNYFWQLTWARDAGQACRKPYWIFIQTFGSAKRRSDASCRMPSESELRLQIFSALAWGYTGFIDYKFSGHSEKNPSCYYDAAGKLTRAYHVQRTAISEAMNLGKGLSQLRNTRVGFTAKGGWKGVLAGLSIESMDAGHNLTVGRFRDDLGSANYFMITNMKSGRNVSIAEGTVTVKTVFRGHTHLLELDRLTGKVVVHRLPETPGSPGRFQHVFSLPGGTGTLFKLNDGKPFALQGQTPR